MAKFYRRVCCAFVLLVAAGVAARAQTAPSPDLRDDQFATAYQINPAHSGGITFDQSFAPPLKVLWNDTAEGAMSYPLVARGKVFIWVSHFTDLNQNAGRLYALDKTSGMVLWQADLPALQGYAGLAYDAGRVFLLTLDGVLTAFDADSGAQQWSVQPTNGAFSPPIAANGRVFLSSSNASGIPETLFAIDETSGSTLWSQALSGATMMLGALSDQGVFATDVCNVQGFNPVTGTPLSPSSFTGSPSGGFACDNATVVAAYYRGFLYSDLLTTEGGIFDVNASSLAGIFSASTAVTVEMVPAFQGSAGYFTSMVPANANGVFSAFDFRSGATLWSVAAPTGQISPIVVNDTVYHLDGNGTLHAFDRVSGTELWSGNGGSFVRNGTLFPLSGMAAGEGILVVPVGLQLYALVPASGE